EAHAPGLGELLQVSVSDTGCGIPAEEHDRIFDRLHQIKAGDATTEQGVGLGLYLCRELVQLHGGNIWVESEPGRGSRFAFVLPKSQQSLRSKLLVIDGEEPLRSGEAAFSMKPTPKPKHTKERQHEENTCHGR